MHNRAATHPDLWRIDPPFWWTEMENKFLQILIHGKKIAQYQPGIEHNDILLRKTYRPENPDYLILDLHIHPQAQPGTFYIHFSKNLQQVFAAPFELRARTRTPTHAQGFGTADSIYLIMPDRFANGNPKNDNVPQMHEKTDRQNPNGRHGGDLDGIGQKLDYIKELGITTLWLTPFFENNMPAFSYHGYAITDFFRTDPRLGSNNQYAALVNECHARGLKIIIDMVFNHCGSENFLYKNAPAHDWFHHFPDFTQTNNSINSICDPYAAQTEREKLKNGWFDRSMPDFNQDNPHVENYLIQHSIWWIEFSGANGIRLDTAPYTEEKMLRNWLRRIFEEFPKLHVVTETWTSSQPQLARWQNQLNKPLPKKAGIIDFPLFYAIQKALTHSNGISELYNLLAQDFLYQKPENNVIFLDNHDTDRFFTAVNHNFNLYRIGLSILLTLRGIPQIFYATEILADGTESNGHGFIRKDFPGGWQTDTRSAFSPTGRTPDENRAYQFLARLLNWRKSKTAIHKGKMKHYMPENQIYVYFRYLPGETVMIIVNTGDSTQLPTHRFREMLQEYTSATDVLTDEKLGNINSIPLRGKSARILELD